MFEVVVTVDDDILLLVFVDGRLLKFEFIDCTLLLLLVPPALLYNNVDVDVDIGVDGPVVVVEVEGERGLNLLVVPRRRNGGGVKLVGFIVGLSVGWNVGLRAG